MEFLRQRRSSDYCAVYAAAMWLSMMGRPTTRRESHLVFGTHRLGWRPPDEFVVASVLCRLLGGRAILPITQRFRTAAAFVGESRQRLQRTSALLVAGTCRLHDPRVTARHAFVVTGHEGGALCILDSLGPAPTLSNFSNGSITPSKSVRRFVPAAGLSWDLDLAFPIVFIGGAS